MPITQPGASLADGDVTTAKIAAAAVTDVKIGTGLRPTILLTFNNIFAVIAGTWTLSKDTNMNDETLISNATTHTLNDEINFKFFLPAGNYNLQFHGIKSSDSGIGTFTLDATEIGTADMYNATGTYNNKFTISNFAQATSGMATLKIKLATKNASSSDYYFRLTTIAIWSNT